MGGLKKRRKLYESLNHNVIIEWTILKLIQNYKKIFKVFVSIRIGDWISIDSGTSAWVSEKKDERPKASYV